MKCLITNCKYNGITFLCSKKKQIVNKYGNCESFILKQEDKHDKNN